MKITRFTKKRKSEEWIRNFFMGGHSRFQRVFVGSFSRYMVSWTLCVGFWSRHGYYCRPPCGLLHPLWRLLQESCGPWQAPCGLLQPLCGVCRHCVGCSILYVDCSSLQSGCYNLYVNFLMRYVGCYRRYIHSILYVGCCVLCVGCYNTFVGFCRLYVQCTRTMWSV